ncbi:MAG: PIN domain-containing protein [Gemmatimonadetes bacterium]|nr:PIN domain-containing protein [Gemmatimonadota bacterium]
MTVGAPVVTVDASVWVAAAVASEAHHAECLALVRHLRLHDVRMVQPTLFPVELAAALGRRFPGSAQAPAAVRLLAAFSSMEVLPLEAELAAIATRLAADCGLRGADAVYVATALRADATLITLDEDVLRRAAPFAAAWTPGRWLASR